MSKSFDLWISFLVFVAFISAMRVAESSTVYPALTDDLKQTCVSGDWHPGCRLK